MYYILEYKLSWQEKIDGYEFEKPLLYEYKTVFFTEPSFFYEFISFCPSE